MPVWGCERPDTCADRTDGEAGLRAVVGKGAPQFRIASPIHARWAAGQERVACPLPAEDVLRVLPCVCLEHNRGRRRVSVERELKLKLDELFLGNIGVEGCFG